MNRGEFEHVLRAAAAIVGDELIVIGSQVVLAHHHDAPAELLRSHEVDLYPRKDPERAEQIDGAMGDGSPFHAEFDYYAHGVGPETLVAPEGWEDRLVRLELSPIRKRDGKVIAWCLSMHDLVLAKLAAGREHDLEFAEATLAHGLVDGEQLMLGVDLIPESHREIVRERVQGLISKTDRQTTNPTG
jgi:hypothetical protein